MKVMCLLFIVCKPCSLGSSLHCGRPLLCSAVQCRTKSLSRPPPAQSRPACRFSLFSPVLKYPLPSSSHRSHFLNEEQRSEPPVPEGRTDRSGHKPQRSVLLRAGAAVPPQLHIEVQSDGGGGAEAALPPGVPQCLSAGRCAPKVRCSLANICHLYDSILIFPPCACCVIAAR